MSNPDTQVARVPQAALAERMDAGYWHPRFRVLDALFERVDSTTIGALDPYMRYGAIVTGERPPETGGDVLRIDPSAFRPTGLDWSKCVPVPEGSQWDRPQARVAEGDLLFVRSGVGSIGRCAVFEGRRKAVAGCFVDIVRQQRLCPHYLCAFLHSQPGRLQMERLMSGVGTVNLSFGEIKSLRVALLDEPTQQAVSAAWRASAQAHAAGAERKARELQAEAIEPFDALLAGAQCDTRCTGK